MSTTNIQKSRQFLLKVAAGATLCALNLSGMTMAHAATTTRAIAGNPVGNTYKVNVVTYFKGEVYTVSNTCFKFLPGSDPAALNNLPTLNATPFGSANFAVIEPGTWQATVVGDFGTLVFNGTVKNSPTGKLNALIAGTIKDYTHLDTSYTFSGNKVRSCTVSPISYSALKLRKSSNLHKALHPTRGF